MAALRAPATLIDPLDYGRAPRPACPEHVVEMRAASTAEVIRYWRCPVPGCGFRSREVKGTRHATTYRIDGRSVRLG